MKKIIFIFISVWCVQPLFAQAQFITKAKIEFERKTNIWVDLNGPFAEAIKKATPQFKTDYFDYQFEDGKSIYKAGRESNNKSLYGNIQPGDNVVFTDFTSGTSISKKNVFEKEFLIADSLTKFKWKITNDFRDIAGFNCRRATTIIMDSVFVVAFYTDEIMIPGGPEGFNGLPGMILGLVINRLHTTWYATKVEVNSVNLKEIAAPAKGKKITNRELKDNLKKLMKDWGEYADRNLWAIMI